MSRKIYIIIAMVFTVVLSVSTFFIIRNHIDSAKQNEVYGNLAEIVEDEPPKENEGVTFSEDKDYLVFLLGPDAASHGGCLRRQSDRADQGHDRGVHGAFCHG